MFETLTVTTLLLIAFFFWQNQRLGLTSAVPKDPVNRMQYFCSEALVQLKQVLPHANIVELQPERLSFKRSGESKLCQIWAENGKLILLPGESQEILGTLGEEGSVRFEKASEQGLLVVVEARSGEANHRLSLRLEVSYS